MIPQQITSLQQQDMITLILLASWLQIASIMELFIIKT